jgi:hypothetical protein
MTNKKIWLGMLALALIFGMTVVGCGGGSGDDGDDPNSGNPNSGNPNSGGAGGKITITGLSAYNGKYVFGEGGYVGKGETLAAVESVDLKTGEVTGGLVKNGTVTLNVWEEYNGSGRPFTGSGACGFALGASSTPKYNSSTSNNWQAIGYVFLTLTYGSGSGQFTTVSP